jgi:hypothetical protein
MKRYQVEKTGIFKVDLPIWNGKGWMTEEKELTIKGETADHYILYYIETEDFYFNEEGEQVDITLCMPVLIGKSRLIKWMNYAQLTIF